MGSVTGERRCLTDRDGRALRTAPGRCPCDQTPEHPTGFVSLPPRLTPVTWAGSSGQGGVRSLDFRADEQTPTHHERHVRRSGGVTLLRVERTAVPLGLLAFPGSGGVGFAVVARAHAGVLMPPLPFHEPWLPPNHARTLNWGSARARVNQRTPTL